MKYKFFYKTLNRVFEHLLETTHMPVKPYFMRLTGFFVIGLSSQVFLYSHKF